jgi:hypothetical protein
MSAHLPLILLALCAAGALGAIAGLLMACRPLR